MLAQHQPAKPALIYKGASQGPSNFTQYNFAVSNYSSYAAELFRPAPDLPPCGLNRESSRMWVEIYGDHGERIYGFCAIKASTELQKLWFAVPTGKPAPKWIRVTLEDRRTGQKAEGRLDIPAR
jgi:hypothetical protein